MNKEIYIWRASKEELEVKIVYRSTQPEMLDFMERKYKAEQQRANNDSKRWQDNESN